MGGRAIKCLTPIGVIYKLLTSEVTSMTAKIKQAWVVEATTGNINSNEYTFQWACIPLIAAADEIAAIAIVGANKWRPSGGQFVTAMFAYKTDVLLTDIGTSGHYLSPTGIS